MYQGSSPVAADIKSVEDFSSLNTLLFRYLVRLNLSLERDKQGMISYSLLLSLSDRFDTSGECLEIFCSGVRDLHVSQPEVAVPALELRFNEEDGKYIIRDESHDECLSFSCQSVIAAH